MLGLNFDANCYSMKKYCTSLLLLLLFIATSTAFAQKKKQKDAYKIDMTIKGIADSTGYLSYYYGKGQYYRDTAIFNGKGQISFTGKDTLAHGMYSLIVNNSKQFDLLLDAQFFSLATDTVDQVKNMKVKGSPENVLFYEYLGFLNEKQGVARELSKKQDESTGAERDQATEDLKKLDDEVRAFIQGFHERNKGSFASNFVYALEYPEVPPAPEGADSTFGFKYFKKHFFDRFNFTDERLLRTSTFHEKLAYYLDKLTLQDPDSLIHAMDYILKLTEQNDELFRYTLTNMTAKYERSENMGMDAVFVHLAKNYFMKGRAKKWYDDKELEKLAERANALEPLLIGKKAPNIVVKDTAQKEFLQLYDVDANFTIVYIWSPDCGHCKVATPKLKKLYDKYKDKGVEVFGVGNEFENEEWIEFINKHKLDWINGSDGPTFKSNFRHSYDVYSTPQTYLLDKDKKILSKKMSIESLERILEYFMKKEEAKQKNEK